MTIKELLQDYVDNKKTAIEVISTLTGIINPDQAVNIIAIVNQVARHANKDISHETFKDVWGLK